MKVTLAVPYYVDDSSERQGEINTCVQTNLGNDLIDKVILVCDRGIDAQMAEDLFGDKAYVVLNEGERQTYKHLVSAMIPFDGVKIISNADIFWTEDSVRLVKDNIGEKECFALSRYDKTSDGWKLRNTRDTQDSWVYLNNDLPEDDSLDIQMGKAGCDNKVLHEIRELGLSVTNPSKDVMTFHLHETEKRNYDPDDRLEGPYSFEEPSELPSSGPTEVKSVVVAPIKNIDDHNAEVRKGFSDVFERVVEFDWRKKRNELGDKGMKDSLVDLISSKQPDAMFLQVQEGGIFTKEFLRSLRTFVVNWTGDVRDYIPEWMLDVGSSVGSTAFSNMDDVHKMRALGFNSHYLQIGFDNEMFTPDGPKAICPDIVFMGNDYGDRFPKSAFRASMAYTLRRMFGSDFGLYGGRWEDVHINLNGQEENEAAVYRGCKIGINCSHYDHERYSSDRILRIMGSGAFCLTNYFPGIEHEYEIGEHLDVFYGIDDLISKIKYYLSDDLERNRIAFKGCKHVHENHTWKQRAEDFRDIVLSSPTDAPELDLRMPEEGRDAEYRRTPKNKDSEDERQQKVIDEAHRKMTYEYQSQAMKRMIEEGFTQDKKLSILIPSVSSRRRELKKLRQHLEKQIEDFELNDKVEIVVEQDGCYWPIGAKRNKLMMECSGEYIWFIDDDDRIDQLALRKVMDKLESGEPDAVVFDIQVNMTDTGNTMRMKVSNKYDAFDCDEENGVFYRPPLHINVLKRRVAMMYPFYVFGQAGNNRKDRGDYGSDVHFSRDMKKGGAIKSCERIPETLYFYDRKEEKEDGTEG